MKQTAKELKTEIFIQAYLKTNDKIKAYQAAYPKATKESARVLAHSLFQDPYIRHEIITREKKIITKADEIVTKQLASVTFGQVLTFIRKREILSQIAEGDPIIIQKQFWDADKKEWYTLDITEKASHSARIAAIELDCRMTGELAPTKMFGAFGRVNDDGEAVVERFVIMANGEKIPL